MDQDPLWWQRGPIYQLIVRSYCDTNGDGEGDLAGLISRLDYLDWLGVEAIWLSPIHPSPLRDLGYDVTDYRGVHPCFGSMDAFAQLVEEAHAREIKVIMDWVPNHTSDEHPWFEESRSSRDNPKRDWYRWADPGPDGGPPNNWVSVFGGSMWEWDEKTEQYYLHTFLEEQPDLSWHTPEVRNAMLDVLRFWLDRGVDGFRIDATDLLIKDEQLRDNPPNPDYEEGQPPDNKHHPHYTRDQPQVHDVLAGVSRVVDEYDDRMVAGELYLPTDKVVTYYGEGDAPELHLPLNLDLCWVPWEADRVKDVIEDYLDELSEGEWPTWTASTHDAQRLASRLEGEQVCPAAMLLLTLPGTPTLYYGQEIGMHGTDVPPERRQDPQGRRIGRSRDGARTPMQWNAEEHAGFTTGTPWLPVAEDYEAVNVARQQDDEQSLLALYRRLIHLRRDEPVLISGRYERVDTSQPLVAYVREHAEQRLLVALNLGSDAQTFALPHQHVEGEVLLSTFLDREEHVEAELELRGDEGVILAV